MAVVLIADPDAGRISETRALLRREGHRTLLAADGASCLDKAVRSHPAMVVADVALPGLDGFGLCLSIREDIPPENLTIILLKSEVSSDDKTTAEALCANAILEHAEDEEVLLDTVRTALAGRSPQEGSVAGQFDQESLFAMLQFLHQRRVTGTLSISGVPGTIAFAGGEIIGARCRALSGADAFQAMLKAKSGRYCFDSGLVDPAARNIERAFDPLMMDAFISLG
ncbi:MAG: response regulator [Myxococcota bacterium]